ncbi:pitrilysin family protein [Paenalcaligenes sp.]|uniref:M16 family metallopeptidase n=1 Tax=Paenalcaligenes sp. TaxID=1966342 RepID=UPI00260B4BA9|nr:pitrilysin family protein [Paenalcaligenes sp.]
MLTAFKSVAKQAHYLSLIGIFLSPTIVYALPAGVEQITSVEGVTEYRLKNGLKVLFAPDASRPNTTVNMTYLVGSRHENYGQTGMAHLLEHMLFRGTPSMPNALGEFSKRGLAANGTTSLDRTNYYATFAANPETLNWYLDWQADVMVNASIAKADLDAEMTVVRNEMERGENSPFRVLMQTMQSAAYQWHNYGKSTIGARSDVEQVDIEQLRAFYRLYYQPDNAVLIVSGQFDEEQTLAHIAKQFNAIPKPERELPPEYTEEPVQHGSKTVMVRRQGGSPIVAAQYHIPAEADPQFTPLSLGISALGDTPSGLLYKNLVEKNLATSVFSYAAGLRQPGYALFLAELKDDMDPQQALTTLNQTIEEQNQALSQEDLDRIRNQWLNGWSQTYADPASLAAALSESAATGDWRLFFWARDQVESVQLDQVKTALKTWLVADNRTNGIYEPTSALARAPKANTPDVAALLSDYKGKTHQNLADAFDPSPNNIDHSTQREIIELDDQLGIVRVALLPKPTRGDRVHANLAIRFGDPDSLKGSRTIGSATASLLAHGTKKYSRQQIEDRFTELQASVYFSGGPNGVNVDIETVGDNLAPTLDLVLEILREANFPESELNKYKAQRLTQINNAKAEPSALANLTLSRHLNPWPKDDIRYTPTFEESAQYVQSLSQADLLAFHERFYGAGDIRFSATGSFDSETIKQQLKKGLKGWKRAPDYKRAADPYHAVKAEHFTINTPDKANAFYIETLPLKLQDSEPDFVALYLANYLLGQSETSRLWNRVRVSEGLSYDVRSRLQVSSYEPSASWTIYAIHAPENSAKLQAVIQEELATVLKEGFSEQEVQEGIHALLRYRQLARSNDAVLTSTWQSYLDLERTFAWSAHIDEALQKLTAKEVNAVVKKYLQPTAFSSALGADQSKQ